MTLAQEIGSQVQEDKYLKMQRYEIFIAKMNNLYKSEIRFRKRQRQRLRFQRNAALYSHTPLKDILRTYNELTVRGFDSELTARTLQNVSGALRARGYRPRVMNDYSLEEMRQSWRMQKVVDDIQFGLRSDQYFSPVYLAETCNALAEINYKNTDLYPQFFEKINSMLNERFLGTKYHEQFQFNTAIYGGPKNFLSRHYVFKGFENNDEFSEYLKILLDWQQNKQEFNLTASLSPED